MLALIVTYYNNREVLEEFLKSLESNSVHIFTLYIADLSKTLVIKKEFSFLIKLLPSSNKGYSHGVNVGLKRALSDGCDQFCILNYDTIVPPFFIKEVQKSFLSADVFGGKIYYQKGYEFHKTRYLKKDLGHVIWYAGGSIDWNNIFVKHRGVDEVDSGQYDRFEKTEFISGCLFCFTKSIVATVGFWDEHYFLYYEDTDYSERIKRRGLILYYNPDIVLYHQNAGSTGGSGSLLHQQTQSWSRLYFGLKFATIRTKIHLLKNYLLSYLYGQNKKQ